MVETGGVLHGHEGSQSAFPRERGPWLLQMVAVLRVGYGVMLMEIRGGYDGVWDGANGRYGGG